jgi:hypothetical protein
MAAPPPADPPPDPLTPAPAPAVPPPPLSCAKPGAARAATRIAVALRSFTLFIVLLRQVVCVVTTATSFEREKPVPLARKCAPPISSRGPRTPLCSTSKQHSARSSVPFRKLRKPAPQCGSAASLGRPDRPGSPSHPAAAQETGRAACAQTACLLLVVARVWRRGSGKPCVHSGAPRAVRLVRQGPAMARAISAPKRKI